MATNDLITHFFLKGMSADLSPNAEGKETYQYGLNGRLYTENNTVNYTSIDGTIKVFENKNIVKILGYASFIDELVLFVKATGEISTSNQEILGYEKVQKLMAKTFEVSSESNLIELDFTNILEFIEYDIPIYGTNRDDLVINTPMTCTDELDEEIDYSDYYEDVLNYSNVQFCQLDPESSYENNKEYLDAIISIKKDKNNNFVPEVIWRGLLNWSIDSKIITHTVVENSNYKRIYFTDFQTPFKAINLKDKDLSFRTEDELSAFQKSILLEPVVESIGENGIVKSGIVIYAYRLITANGQMTPFSSFSEVVTITPTNSIFEGGRVSESTNKSVNLKVNLKNYEKFQDVELICIEFQAYGSPTAIRQVGKKPVDSVVRFTHYGNESEFDSTLTMPEILDRKTNWNYCSDLTSKNNKLIAAGLRNDPINSILNQLKHDFMFHGWDENGQTHNCLINPNPEKYRYIDSLLSEDRKLYSIKKRVYSSIKVFGNFTITLSSSTESISNTFSNPSNNYKEWIVDIYDWLNETGLEGLEVSYTLGYLVFQSDNVSDYKFTYNTRQYIEDFENEIELNDLVSNGNMIYGAQSLGFNIGNGIRLTFRTEEEEVLRKATAQFKDSKPLLNMNTPSLKKGFMKSEIYRLALLPYDKNGKELFPVPLGDVMIPKLGDNIRYIDDAGFGMITGDFYTNSYVKNDKMYIQRIIMNIEVRVSCEIQKEMSMYKIVYVEREGLNKTILAQGISAPLERVKQFERTEYVKITDKVADKWALPPYGGPSYDIQGLKNFDTKPNGPFTNEGEDRIVTNRKLFYFDSPEFIFGKENIELIKSSVITRVGRLNIETDRGLHLHNEPETFPKFSRRVLKTEMYGEQDEVPELINVNVFLERRADNDNLRIVHAEELTPGLIIPGTEFDESSEISNNAITLMYQSWYYNSWSRKEDKCKIESGLKSELFNSSNYARGTKTVIIKTEEDAFSDYYINDIPYKTPYVFLDRTAPGDMCSTYSTHGLFNIVLNNRDNIYGGRSERDFTRNTYVSLSKAIPVNNNSNSGQRFKVYGDVYTTLYPRQKTIFNSDTVRKNYGINNAGNCSNITDDGINRLGAWAYVVALETKVEPKLSYVNSFYKQNNEINFYNDNVESINEAYFQTNNLKTYVPIPYDFKDDPDMGNLVATSETKLNGDYIDAYLNFKVNNFYELEREGGIVYNLVSDLNNVFAIQESQTSRLFIDENTMMDTSNGQISIQQGSGQGVSSHQIISDYGTSIRRSIVSSISSSGLVEGFTFFDENKKEYVRTNKPMLLTNNLHLDFQERFQSPIIDVEGWYDDKFKETNLRLRFKDGSGIALSYNEKFQAFNGYMNYNEDLYMDWNGDILTPKNEDNLSPYLYQLNKGNPMNILDNQYNLKLKITSNADGVSTLIFKEWKCITNINYPVKQIRINSNYSPIRVVNGTHHRYQIKEAVHTVPLKNRNDRDDFRGNWMEMEVEIESKFNNKVSVFSFTNFVRNSYQ